MEKEKVQIKIKESVYKRPITDLDLTQRAMHVTQRLGYATIEDLIDNKQKLSKTKGCGTGTIKEIYNKIVRMQIEYDSKEVWL